MINTTVTVNLDRQLPLAIVTAKQGDTGRAVTIAVETQYETYDIDTATAKIYVKKPDGTKIFNTVLNNGDGTFIVALTNQCLAVAGDALAELQLTSSDNPNEFISTPVFILRVLPSYIDYTAIQSSNEFNALQQALAMTNSIGMVTPLTLDGDYVEERVAAGYTQVGAVANITLQLSTTAALTASTEYVIASDCPAPLSDVVFEVNMLDSNDDLANIGHAWITAGDDSLHFVPASSMASGDDLDIAVTYMIQDYVAGPQPDQPGKLTDDIKDALLAIFQHVAYADDQGDTYYDALHDALYPPRELSSISATFTQGGATIYDTDSLNVLKTYLVVTAYYSDATSSTVPSTDYTLSGTLEVGTSTITVTYEDMTDTFTVTVTQDLNPILHNWDFKTSLVDSVGNVTATLTKANTGPSLPTRDSDGVHFTAWGQCLDLGGVFDFDTTIEIDFTTFNLTNVLGTYNTRAIMFGSSAASNSGIILKKDGYWSVYSGSWWSGSFSVPSDQLLTYFANKTVSIYVNSSKKPTLRVDGSNLGTSTTGLYGATGQHWYLGNTGGADQGANFFDAVVTGVRIYQGERT